jgi:hypothetical protein
MWHEQAASKYQAYLRTEVMDTRLAERDKLRQTRWMRSQEQAKYSARKDLTSV